MRNTVQTTIGEWLYKRLSVDQWEWLLAQLVAVSRSNSDKALYVTLGMAPRKLGKTDLNLTDAELVQANSVSAGWQPSGWSVDGTARVLTLLSVARRKPEGFAALLRSLCATADVSEAVAYYRALHLFIAASGQPSAEFDDLIGEGLRTNMRAVFEAIAHNNPYPAKQFDEHRWNHMILKALFIDSTLSPIQGLDERANIELAAILCNYAHERWAANRSVTPELWRCVGPHANVAMLEDLQRAAASSDTNEHQGAVLALSQCPLREAASVIALYPETASAIADEELTWDTVAGKLDQ